MKIRTLITVAAVTAFAGANAQFTQLWSAIYPDSAGGIDEAYAIARDARGNTYVTGMSTSTSSGADYVTIKYSPTGQRLWDSPYAGVSGNREDVPSALALDNDGNCYVTGRSEGSDGLFEMATIKLRSSDGVIVEEVRESTLAGYDYYATDIALSADGNVYITGYREDGVFPIQAHSQQYVTVRYGPDFTIPAGTNWPAIYDRTSGDDRGIAIAIGKYPANDVYVTGMSAELLVPHWGTIKYPGSGANAQGQPAWATVETGDSGGIKRSEPVDIAVDDASSVFVTGYMSRSIPNVEDHTNIATISYSGADGARRWSGGLVEYDGNAVNSLDESAELAIEKNFLGEAMFVYVTGFAEMNSGGTNFITLRYPANNATAEDWATSYNGPGNGTDQANGIVVAGNGNLYVTGNSLGTSDSDYATVKYNKAGFQQGSAIRYTSNGESIAWDIAVSCAGKLHVTGLTTPSNRDYLSIVYTQVTTAVNAASYLISPGVYVSGNLASLTSSNDNYLVVRPGIVFGTGDYPAVVTVTGTSSMLDPNELCFTLEASASSAGLTQRVELYDYDSANWVIVDERGTTTSDSTVYVSAPYDARRFVGNDGTLSAYEVKARVSYKQVGPVFTYPWEVKLDLTKWEVLQ